MALTLSRMADRLKTSPGLMLTCRMISFSGRSVMPVAFSSPTRNWGPSTTVNVTVTSARSRFTSTSVDSTRAWT